MQAGKLDTRFSLRRHSTGQDAIGQPLTTWVEVGELWANVKHLTGVATLKAGAETSVTKVSIRVRFNSLVAPDMRLVHKTNGTVYKILDTLPDRRGGFIDLPCEVVK